MVGDAQTDLRRKGSDRRLRRSVRFPERRSGFDRRVKSGWRGQWEAELRRLAARPSTILLVLATIVVFNFLDYYLTLRVLDAGGTELNPVMARLFAMGSETAALVKLGLGGAAVLTLLALRRYRRTLEVSLLLLVGFSLLMFYHAAVAINIYV